MSVCVCLWGDGEVELGEGGDSVISSVTCQMSDSGDPPPSSWQSFFFQVGPGVLGLTCLLSFPSGLRYGANCGCGGTSTLGLPHFRRPGFPHAHRGDQGKARLQEKEVAKGPPQESGHAL